MRLVPEQGRQPVTQGQLVTKGYQLEGKGQQLVGEVRFEAALGCSPVEQVRLVVALGCS